MSSADMKSTLSIMNWADNLYTMSHKRSGALEVMLEIHKALESRWKLTLKDSIKLFMPCLFRSPGTHSSEQCEH
jgi:hypothetical protein